MNRKTSQEIFNEVKENHKKLRECKLHDFRDITLDRKINKKYQCNNCKGEINSINHSWYLRGLRDG